MEKSISIPYRFIILSEDIEEVKKMRVYNNQVIPDKSTAIAVDTNEQFIFQDGKWIKVIEDGMSIDESIEVLKEHLRILNVDKGIGFWKEVEALEMALDTMRKYQQIEQIVDHYKDNVRDKVINENMEKILKVVKDGTN